MTVNDVRMTTSERVRSGHRFQTFLDANPDVYSLVTGLDSAQSTFPFDAADAKTIRAKCHELYIAIGRKTMIESARWSDEFTHAIGHRWVGCWRDWLESQKPAASSI
jgi:hypothetical protein